MIRLCTKNISWYKLNASSAFSNYLMTLGFPTSKFILVSSVSICPRISSSFYLIFPKIREYSSSFVSLIHFNSSRPLREFLSYLMVLELILFSLPICLLSTCLSNSMISMPIYSNFFLAISNRMLCSWLNFVWVHLYIDGIFYRHSI